jgi:hypothetical protein
MQRSRNDRRDPVEQLAQDRSIPTPTLRKEFERIVEGARKAGLPER